MACFTVKSSPTIFRIAIIGKEVSDILLDEDGLGISLAEGWNISVWSAILLYWRGEKIELRRITELIGASLIEFVGSAARERLVFSNGFEVVIELDARKSSQPEAMMVRGPENLIIVWND